MSQNGAIYVVIRSVSERTTDACQRLVELEIPTDHISIIFESPFSNALKKGCEIGMDKNFPWTLFIDADVLLRENAITTLLQHATKSPDHYSETHGLILDKFLNTAKPAGARLYRTSLLEKAIEFIPVEGTDLRPEYHMLNQMNENGHPWLGIGYICGLHDYEQSFQDIFRKFYVHAHKHSDRINDLLPYFRVKAQSDPDFQVALWGLAAGIASINDVRIDKDRVPIDIYKFYAGNNWIEKGELAYTKAIDEMVENTINSFLKNQDYDNMDERLLIPVNFGKTLHHKNISLFRKATYHIGNYLHRAGKKIKRISLT
jgi:hypothetical protein